MKFEIISQQRIREIRFAFGQSIPVLLGYIFLGFAFGLMLQDAGYGVWWAFLASVTIYSGTLQFLLVGFLTGGVSLLTCLLMSVFVNARYAFYGLSMLERFKRMGKAYVYMIFSLTDETYSILCSLKTPPGMNGDRISFYISLMDHLYWITGAVLGSFLGSLEIVNVKGVEFSMTALFVVIVLNQWQETREHRPALIGGGVGLAGLIVLGGDRFLLPALAVTAGILLGLRREIEARPEEEEGEVKS